jgi:prolyl-tRNA editing enzyme YbaK/EbsC (Cys-tRNA(Pro) deacylase)
VNPILEQIRGLLGSAGVAFREVHHEPTYTSEDSARARGEDLRIGGKALLLKADDDFKVFVVSAARRLDSGAIRKHLGLRRSRFATKEELEQLTGLVPGAVPPFGRPVLPFDLYADPSVLENERIAFNAGSLTDSIIVGVDDWARIAKPEVFRFAL